MNLRYLDSRDMVNLLMSVLLLLLIWRILVEILTDSTGDATAQPDWANLTDLDLEALEDGETRRIRTVGGDTYRLEAETVETEEDMEE
jgi:hypothetical protein